MKMDAFLKTLYLGDRGLKSVLIDGWNAEIKIQATCISRVRSETWDYYTKEDLVDGFIVFEGVTSVSFEPSGVVPNDQINELLAEPLGGDGGNYQVTLSVDSVDLEGVRTEVVIRIQAASVALEEHGKAGHRIRD